MKFMGRDINDPVYVESRAIAAKNPHTTLKVLKILANDKLWFIRAAVAGNPNTDLETLKKLAEDEDWRIRLAVAKNQNTDPETLKKLAKDFHRKVRRAAFKNVQLALDALHGFTRWGDYGGTEMSGPPGNSRISDKFGNEFKVNHVPKKLENDTCNNGDLNIGETGRFCQRR